MREKIPKRIIQIWGGGKLPPIAKASAVNVKLLNPDFEYIFFDDIEIKKFIDKQNEAIKKIIKNFRYEIQKYDLIRYLIIHNYGGFYFDSDFLLYENLYSLLRYECVFPIERIAINNYLINKLDMIWDLGNYAFGATPGHPFIGKIIENCINATKEPVWLEEMLKSVPWIYRKDSYVLSTTGPFLVTKTYAENKDLHNSVKILFPQNRFDRKEWNRFGQYGTHLMSMTWKEKKNKLQRMIWRRYRLLIENRNIRTGRVKEKVTIDD